MKQTVDYTTFQNLDIRSGTIIEAEDFPEARKPAYKLRIDFGEEGIKQSSAQITEQYKKADLLHKQVVAIINFPDKQIGPFRSECLVLGVEGTGEGVVLLQPDKPVANGLPIG